VLSFFQNPPLPAGSPAPDFTLRDQDGNAVSLSSLRGKNVVLVFYPRDETPVCRQQLCEFRDAQPLTASKDTVVLGVNPGNQKSHAAFRNRYHLPFRLLVDKGGGVSEKYKAKGFLWTTRTVYLIGRDGRIRYAQRGKPAPSEVLAAAE
jgi:peroxiredoxin Q/BCP